MHQAFEFGIYLIESFKPIDEAIIRSVILAQLWCFQERVLHQCRSLLLVAFTPCSRIFAHRNASCDAKNLKVTCTAIIAFPCRNNQTPCCACCHHVADHARACLDTESPFKLNLVARCLSRKCICKGYIVSEGTGLVCVHVPLELVKMVCCHTHQEVSASTLCDGSEIYRRRITPFRFPMHVRDSGQQQRFRCQLVQTANARKAIVTLAKKRKDSDTISALREGKIHLRLFQFHWYSAGERIDEPRPAACFCRLGVQVGETHASLPAGNHINRSWCLLCSLGCWPAQRAGSGISGGRGFPAQHRLRGQFRNLADTGCCHESKLVVRHAEG